MKIVIKCNAIYFLNVGVQPRHQWHTNRTMPLVCIWTCHKQVRLLLWTHNRIKVQKQESLEGNHWGRKVTSRGAEEGAGQLTRTERDQGTPTVSATFHSLKEKYWSKYGKMLIFIKSRWWLLWLLSYSLNHIICLIFFHNLTVILKEKKDILSNEGKINDCKLSLRAFSNRGSKH